MEGKPYQEGKIYVSDNLRRIEMNNIGNEKTVVILDVKANKGYVLIDSKKLYTELGDIKPFMQDGKPLKSNNTSIVGSAVINGLKCKISQTDLGNGIKQMIWYSEEIDFPVKIETEIDGNSYMTIIYQNIKQGPNDKKLFILPINYKKLSSH
jgi:outer membrane lipoprotein-sorting protein